MLNFFIACYALLLGGLYIGFWLAVILFIGAMLF